MLSIVKMIFHVLHKKDFAPMVLVLFFESHTLFIVFLLILNSHGTP